MIDERTVSRMLGMRFNHWPSGWPLPSGAQFVMLRALLKARPDTFVAAVNPPSREYRVVVLTRRNYRAGTGPFLGAREYVMFTDGRLRYCAPGEPYHHTEEQTNAA